MDPESGKSELTLVWPAARDEELFPMLINAQPGNDFSVKQERLTEEDMAKRAKLADEHEESKKPAPRSKASRRSGGGRGALSQARTGAKRRTK